VDAKYLHNGGGELKRDEGEDVNSAKWYHSLFFLVENSLIIRFHWQRIKKKYKKYK